MRARVLWLVTACAICVSIAAQTRDYPKEIRGYKVERAAVELKSSSSPVNPPPKTPSGDQSSSTDGNSTTVASANTPPPSTSNVDQLITFGAPSLGRVTPLGITFDVPVIVAPIKQSGHVDFLLFEDMTVNEHSVEIAEYHRGFDLPKKKPLTLHEPLRFHIYLPVVALAAVDEWTNSKDTWPVTGRVYVCGRYKKFFLSFKRCVPVELNLTMQNPLRRE